MNKPYLELVGKIRDAVREKAQEVPIFRESGNGAIRILAYPLCKEADDWFGGLGKFFGKYIKPVGTAKPEISDIPDYEHTFAISPCGSRVITGVWDGVKQTVDCYAYSAMKIAHCSHAQDLGIGLLSGLPINSPYLTEDNGYAAHKGALCIEVQQDHSVYDAYDREHPRKQDYCGIYVCVSGADSEDDLKCAFAAVQVIKDFFTTEIPNRFIINAPDYPQAKEE